MNQDNVVYLSTGKPYTGNAPAPERSKDYFTGYDDGWGRARKYFLAQHATKVNHAFKITLIVSFFGVLFSAAIIVFISNVFN